MTGFKPQSTPRGIAPRSSVTGSIDKTSTRQPAGIPINPSIIASTMKLSIPPGKSLQQENFRNNYPYILFYAGREPIIPKTEKEGTGSIKHPVPHSICFESAYSFTTSSSVGSASPSSLSVVSSPVSSELIISSTKPSRSSS